MANASARISVANIASDILTRFCEANASDIHIVPGFPATYRINGKLTAEGPPLTIGAVKTFLSQITDGDILATLLNREEIDLALKYDLDSFEVRFRINIALASKAPYAVIRRLKDVDKTPMDLGVPDEFVNLCSHHSHGVVFVTGTTGSGKSTTLSSVLAHLLRAKPYRVVTLEDPIEYIIPPGVGVVTQREIGQDTKTFPTALRAAMRQDPDVILVGEVRDGATAEAMLSAAETGHLVFATLHVGSATNVPDRIAGLFKDATEGTGAKKRLYNVLAGIMTQVLVPSKKGRSLGWELLPVGKEQRQMFQENNLNGLRDFMADNRFRMADCLVRLAASGVCPEEVARPLANYSHEWDDHYMVSQRGIQEELELARARHELALVGLAEDNGSPFVTDSLEGDIVLRYI